ncbi:hypothetical protein [Anaplasma phagocytophilum]|uniref:hypothetical protein n=1 Tax=Anaplasma phagocytophilum TaxID=948 RepID=UPI000B1D4BAD|nr:hypothetical protein [Anaplasma phagocytophilum]
MQDYIYSVVLNSGKGYTEYVGRILLMHENNREDIREIKAGDIAALAGLKKTTTQKIKQNLISCNSIVITYIKQQN